MPRDPVVDAVALAIQRASDLDPLDIRISSDREPFHGGNRGREVLLDFDEVEVNVPARPFVEDPDTGLLVQVVRGTVEITVTLSVRTDDHRVVLDELPGWAVKLASDIRSGFWLDWVRDAWRPVGLALQAINAITSVPGDDRDERQLSIAILQVVFNRAYQRCETDRPANPDAPRPYFDRVEVNTEAQLAIRGAVIALDEYPMLPPAPDWRSLHLGWAADLVAGVEATAAAGAQFNVPAAGDEYPRVWRFLAGPSLISLNRPDIGLVVNDGYAVVLVVAASAPAATSTLVQRRSSGLDPRGWDIVATTGGSLLLSVYGDAVEQATATGQLDGAFRTLLVVRNGAVIELHTPDAVHTAAIVGVHWTGVPGVQIKYGDSTGFLPAESPLVGEIVTNDPAQTRTDIAAALGTL